MYIHNLDNVLSIRCCWSVTKPLFNSVKKEIFEFCRLVASGQYPIKNKNYEVKCNSLKLICIFMLKHSVWVAVKRMVNLRTYIRNLISFGTNKQSFLGSAMLSPGPIRHRQVSAPVMRERCKPETSFLKDLCRSRTNDP